LQYCFARPRQYRPAPINAVVRCTGGSVRFRTKRNAPTQHHPALTLLIMARRPSGYLPAGKKCEIGLGNDEHSGSPFVRPLAHRSSHSVVLDRPLSRCTTWDFRHQRIPADHLPIIRMPDLPHNGVSTRESHMPCTFA
jgi:hypothetical protein